MEIVLVPELAAIMMVVAEAVDAAGASQGFPVSMATAPDDDVEAAQAEKEAKVMRIS